MTPSEEMRAAAAKLRSLVADVEQEMLANPFWWLEPKDDAYALGVANVLGRPAGNLASALNPRVAGALAVVLNAAAEDAEMVGPDWRLLALARELLEAPVSSE